MLLCIIFLLFSSVFPFPGISNTGLTKFNKINLSSKDYYFKLLGDLEGTSMILKIKDTNKETIAVFKPSSGSTNHRGEYASYKLGKILGLEVYPQVKIATIPFTRLTEIKEILKKIKFKKFHGKKHVSHMKRKEENRKKMLKHLNSLIKKKQGLEGALKLWVKKLMFSEQVGTLKSFVKHPIYFQLATFMKQKDINAKKNYVSFRQYTKIFKPEGTYYWFSNFQKLTKNFSTMLLIDAILGNRDRFPGGNVHFAPLRLNLVKEDGNKINFNEASLISIDNGAVLQEKNEALVLLKKLKIKRFSKHVVKKLTYFFKQDSTKIQKILQLNKKETSLVISNAKKVLRYIETLNKRYSNKIYL